MSSEAYPGCPRPPPFGGGPVDLQTVAPGSEVTFTYSVTFERAGLTPYEIFIENPSLRLRWPLLSVALTVIMVFLYSVMEMTLCCCASGRAHEEDKDEAEGEAGEEEEGEEGQAATSGDTLLVFADSETTGFSGTKDRMLEWSSVFALLHPDNTIETLPEMFDSYAHFDGVLKKEVDDLLGIDHDHLKSAPPFKAVFEAWETQVQALQRRLRPAQTYLVGYNFAFDLRFLRAELARVDRDLDKALESLNITKVRDLMAYAEGIPKFDHEDRLQRTELGNVSFTQTSVFLALFGREPINAHNGLADCRNLRLIAGHPNFPDIHQDPPAKVDRRCPECKAKHTSQSKCRLYLESRGETPAEKNGDDQQ